MKVINVRLAMFCAIGIIVGILCGYEILFANYAFAIIFGALIVVLGVVFAICKKSTWAYCLLALIFAFLGYFVFDATVQNLNKKEIAMQQTTLTGRVTDLYRNGNDSNVLYLEECVTKDGKVLSGRVKMYTYDGSAFETGNIITVYGTICSTYPIQSTVQTTLVRNNVNYEIFDCEVIKIEQGKLHLDEISRKYIFDACNNFSFSDGSILYALLTGDTNALGEDDIVAFRRTGTLHLLAVSGQHIVFIVGVFAFFLKKFKLHPLVELIILMVPLVFFCYICNFVPSVVRALLMLVCAYLAKILFSRYDMLTSLSWSVLLILIFKPLFLFDIGFQLSVLSVYGIATTYSFATNLLKKVKMPKILRWFVDALTLSVSCSVAIALTLACGFGEVSLIAPFINIFTVPIVSVAFVVAMAGVLPWVFHYLLYVADGLLIVVQKMVLFVSKWNFSSVSLVATGITVVMGILLMFLLGGFVKAKVKQKVVVGGILFALIVASLIVSALPQKTQNQIFVKYGYDEPSVVVTSSSGQMTVISSFSDEYTYEHVAKYAKQYDVKSCTLCIRQYNQTNLQLIEDFVQDMDNVSVYLLDNYGNDALDEFFASKSIKVVRNYKNTQIGDDVKVRSVFDGVLTGVLIEVDQLNIAVCFGDDVQLENFTKLVTSADLYVLPECTQIYQDMGAATLSFRQHQFEHNFGANKYGNFTISQKDGTIDLSFR